MFIKPMQPLHFTRGYIWASLFLLGLPVLHGLFENKKLKIHPVALIFFSVLLFSDNFLWITNAVRFPQTSASISCISEEQKNLLHVIDDNSSNKTLLIGNDEVLVYMSTVYSKAYTWISHPFTTPFVAKKEKAYHDFIENGIIDSSWKNRETIFVFHKNDSLELHRSQSLSFAVRTLASSQNYILQKTVLP
jgi:hypothetical protein